MESLRPSCLAVLRKALEPELWPLLASEAPTHPSGMLLSDHGQPLVALETGFPAGKSQASSVGPGGTEFLPGVEPGVLGSNPVTMGKSAL